MHPPQQTHGCTGDLDLDLGRTNGLAGDIGTGHLDLDLGGTNGLAGDIGTGHLDLDLGRTNGLATSKVKDRQVKQAWKQV